MTRIIGIDPGSRCTGYGIIDSQDQRLIWVAHGQIKTTDDTLNIRLQQIFQQLKDIIGQYQPDTAAIEQVFMQKNAQAALKLGQARGAAMVATSYHHLPLGEYSPRQIKQAIVGYGAAAKAQVQHMVRSLLRLTEAPPSDAADALAIAICHCHSQSVSRRLSEATVTAGVEA